MEHRSDPQGMTPAAVTVPAIHVPALLTFLALLAGLAVGWLFADAPAIDPLLAVVEPIGRVWLHALQATIIPLVAALLVTGISGMVATASAGVLARRTIGTFIAVLACGTLVTAFTMPPLLAMFPIPSAARTALQAGDGASHVVPGIGDFVESLVAPNIVAAAAETAMLPLVLFFAALGVAAVRLPDRQREVLLVLFAGLGNAMLVLVGWILRIAPIGAFALAIGVAARGGGSAAAVLVHYVLIVSGGGVVVLAAAYALAILAGRQAPLRFARTVLPVQALAVSTQSSLACLPAMLTACRSLGVRQEVMDFVLPLAVAVFRATSPAMNLAVAIYVAKLSGVELTAGVIAAGAAVALITTVGSVSLPGSVSFIASVGPIALAMGAPIEPLALLVAVEMLPDLVRTVGNVTMDVAVTTTLDGATTKSPGNQMGENGSQ